MLNVKNFGAVGNGIVDDTSAMQAAHNSGRVIYYPAGNYKFSTLQIASGGLIGEGTASAAFAGTGATVLTSTDTTSADAILYTGNSATGGSPIFRDFALLVNQGRKSSGAGLRLSPNNPATNTLQAAKIENVLIRYFPSLLVLENCSGFTIMNCKLFFYSVAAITLSNNLRPDCGDGSIYGCEIFNGNGAQWASRGVGILQYNSGGLKISSNKFNGGLHGYLLNLTKQTSDTLFLNNSFENISGVSIAFKNNANAASNPVRYNNVVITGNQFSGNKRDIYFEQIANYYNLSYWDTISISGNTFYFPASTAPCIELASARAFFISGNSLNGNGTGAIPIQIDASCYNGSVGSNGIAFFTNGNLVVNNSKL